MLEAGVFVVIPVLAQETSLPQISRVGLQVHWADSTSPKPWTELCYKLTAWAGSTPNPGEALDY